MAAVVISGLGLWTPAGAGARRTWTALRQGRGARAEWVAAEGGQGPGRPQQWLALRVPGAGGRRTAGGPAGQGRGVDRVNVLALGAAKEACRQAKLARSILRSSRVGCVISTSKGALLSLLEAHKGLLEGQGGQIRTEPWRLTPACAAQSVAEAFRLSGPILSVPTACAAGLSAIARGAEMIREGEAQIVLAGGADASIHPLILAGYERMGVLARDGVCRPFDRRRSGFVLGEGAGVVVLEADQSARDRGIRPLARVLGGTSGADPSGLVVMDQSGRSIAEVMARAIERSGLRPSGIGAVRVHGTGTQANDRAEARALRELFGAPGPWVFALKGAIGHLLGAAGAVETAVAALALSCGQLPPTVGLEDLDPEFADLRFVVGAGGRAGVEPICCVSSGFGGQISAVVLSNAT